MRRTGAPPHRLPRAGTREPAWRPATALVVDGDPVSRRFVEMALGQDGEFAVEVAESVAAAREILRVQLIELVIADTDLADTSGLHFFRTLTQESRMRSIPFVFLSADRRPETRIAALRAGVADYLHKPCHAAELHARAVSLVERERRVREGARRRNYLLAGDLSVMAFPDLVHAIELERRSGVLSIVLAAAVGQVFFAGGRIVHAVYGNLVGRTAVHRFVTETDGAFEFAPGECEIPAADWTIHESATSLVLEGARLADEHAHSRGARRAPEPPPAAPIATDLEPPLASEPGLGNQIAAGLEDPYALGEMFLWTAADLARWTRREIGSSRLHVHVIADLAGGVSALLPLCGAPTERWVLSGLDDSRKVFGVTFFLRRERTVDIALLDIAQPDAFEASLKRVPSVVILAPPGGDVMALGVRSRVAIEGMLRRYRPQVLLVIGNGSLQDTPALRDLARYADACELVPGALGDSPDELRALLARGVRRWGEAPIDTRVISVLEESAS